ncbi:hypothetical protein TNIN_16851 [Trichonephila inaurata madagascariensis]|uniref:Uncharacterized protein n=1 Tax=Trichonephila inaurata madagascariensis TaxID=2747483 RepID=A0A8X6Y4J6_9ARAC|nr:hypothetical protein TNIN_16851 [Trichonephila inaurata madagascariensis]
MHEASFALISQNNVFNLTTDIRNVGRASAQQPVLQTPHWTPHFLRGTTSRKVSLLPPSARQIFAFQHFSSHFGALTRTT